MEYSILWVLLQCDRLSYLYWGKFSDKVEILSDEKLSPIPNDRQVEKICQVGVKIRDTISSLFQEKNMFPIQHGATILFDLGKLNLCLFSYCENTSLSKNVAKTDCDQQRVREGSITSCDKTTAGFCKLSIITCALPL